MRDDQKLMKISTLTLDPPSNWPCCKWEYADLIEKIFILSNFQIHSSCLSLVQKTLDKKFDSSKRNWSSHTNSLLLHIHTQHQTPLYHLPISAIQTCLSSEILYNLGKVSFNGAMPSQVSHQNFVWAPVLTFLPKAEENQNGATLLLNSTEPRSFHHIKNIILLEIILDKSPYLTVSKLNHKACLSTRKRHFHLVSRLILKISMFLISNPPWCLGWHTFS